jgi:hypothetical protein
MMLTGITTTVSLSIMRATEDLHGVWVDPVVAGSGIIGGTGFLLLIDPKALGGHRGL